MNGTGEEKSMNTTIFKILLNLFTFGGLALIVIGCFMLNPILGYIILGLIFLLLGWAVNEILREM
ncbi:MAG: hypothetical protein RBG13Loki_3117 [Promethearchaeota archaeon CR_4]|nr:MAG: hypothetical protein RBG13Loki_3117 [Candidatus Lokiarchaeota archaeon CR_4]